MPVVGAEGPEGDETQAASEQQTASLHNRSPRHDELCSAAGPSEVIKLLEQGSGYHIREGAVCLFVPC